MQHTSHVAKQVFCDTEHDPVSFSRLAHIRIRPRVNPRLLGDGPIGAASFQARSLARASDPMGSAGGRQEVRNGLSRTIQPWSIKMIKLNRADAPATDEYATVYGALRPQPGAPNRRQTIHQAPPQMRRMGSQILAGDIGAAAALTSTRCPARCGPSP